MKIAREHLGITAVALSDKDATSYRPALAHLLLRRTGETSGELVAADGFMLAVVPVSLDADDVPGLIHPEALKAAAKDSPKREPEVTVYVLEDIVRSVEHACYPRVRTINGETPMANKYPDISRIVPRDVPVSGQNHQAMPTSLNFKYLDLLGKALGGLGVTLWPNPIGTSGPLVVTPVTGRGDAGSFRAGLPVAPYGVLMPMHTSGSVSTTIARSREETAA